MSDTLFTICMIILTIVLIFSFSCLLNPLFWQALRNSKWIDSLKKNKDSEELINPERGD